MHVLIIFLFQFLDFYSTSQFHLPFVSLILSVPILKEIRNKRHKRKGQRPSSRQGPHHTLGFSPELSNIPGDKKRQCSYQHSQSVERLLHSAILNVRNAMQHPKLLFHVWMNHLTVWNRFHRSLRIKYCLFLLLKHFSCMVPWPLWSISAPGDTRERWLCPAFKVAAVKTK